jgi:hypothetical protein
LTENEYNIRKKIKEFPTIKNIAYIDNLRGELDLTINKKHITTEPTPYKLFRGRNIGYYRIIDLPDKEYVDPEFVKHTAKQKYISSNA